MSASVRIEASVGAAAVAARDLRRAGWGGVGAAIALVLSGPVWILVLSVLLGIRWPSGAAKFDPVSNASWLAGPTSAVELVFVIGVVILCLGVRRASVRGWHRDVMAVGAGLWIGGLVLWGMSLVVWATPAMTSNWTMITPDVRVRATIGAAVTLTQWGFAAVGIVGMLTWTVAHVAGNRGTGMIGLAAGVPAVVVAFLAAAAGIVGVIPPALTFLQIVVLLLVGIPLLRRARRMAAAVPPTDSAGGVGAY